MRKILVIAVAAMMGIAGPLFTAQSASAADLGRGPPPEAYAPAAATPAFDPTWVIVAGVVGGGLLIACVADWCQQKEHHAQLSP